MGIFSNKFKKSAEKFATIMHRDFSNPLNFVWLHIVILFALIIGAGVMSIFGGIGMQAWWQQYSTTNPNVIPEQTVQYWVWIIADKLLAIAIALQACYLTILFIVWVLTGTKRLEQMAITKRLDQLAIIKNKKTEYPLDNDPTPPITASVITTITFAPVCPDCKNTYTIIKKGIQNGKIRYLCKKCGRYFQKV